MVVRFERPDEAAKGFCAVVYPRLGNSLIYLEKGRLGMFTGEDESTKNSSKLQTISSAI